MRIGAIVPVHGFSPFLTEALDAVISCAPEAVVVVDDGSPTPIALLLDQRDRATIVRRESAGGPAIARAAGLAALGDDVDAVALCDADDVWPAAHLEAHRAALSQGAGWSFGRARVIGPDGLETGERWERPAAGRHSAASLGAALFTANPVPTSSVVLMRDALADAGGFPGPVRVAEDWELWLRLCATGHDAVCVEDDEIAYRRHPGGLTADVAGLAAAQLEVHRRHAALVGDVAARSAMAGDRSVLRREQIRERLPLRRRDPYRR